MTPTNLEPNLSMPIYKRRGLDFGARFRGVKQVWSHAGKALGLIEAPPALGDEPAEYGLHPALLDACIQVVAGAVQGADDDQTETALFMPLGVESFRLFAPAEGKLWSVATVDARCGGSPRDDQGAYPSGRRTRTIDRGTARNVLQARGPARHWNARSREASTTGFTKSPGNPWMKKRPLEHRLRSRNLKAWLDRYTDHLDFFTEASGLNRFEQLRPRLDAVCSAYIAQALREAGANPVVGVEFERRKLGE